MNLLKWNDEMKLGRPFILDFAQSLLPGSANVYQKHGVSTRSLEGFRVVVDLMEGKTYFCHVLAGFRNLSTSVGLHPQKMHVLNLTRSVKVIKYTGSVVTSIAVW